MTVDLADSESKARNAVMQFWGTRDTAVERYRQSGQSGQDGRAAVTGGKNMHGFVKIIVDLVRANGLRNARVLEGAAALTLPGFFRPTKRWDVLVLNNDHLVAAFEFKSQVGSFGKNFNNRTEEVLGSSVDLWTAYREGAFGEQPKPFVGWLMLLEDCDESRKPIQDSSPHFPLFKDFEGASYAERYNILCKKVVREQLYSAASLILSKRTAGGAGEYVELSELTGLKMFFSAFAGHVAAEAARG